jgi:predicted ester cyclase
MIAAGFACVFISCTAKNEGGMSATAKKNLEVDQAVTKCFETKDFSKLGDYIAEDAVDHAGETGDITGLANIKAEMERMMGDMAEMKSDVIKALADDEYVMSWMKYSGSMKVDKMGMKAGEKFETKAIEVTRYKDGKVVEHWSFMEPSEVMKMMGGGQQPPADGSKGTATDTTNTK